MIPQIVYILHVIPVYIPLRYIHTINTSVLYLGLYTALDFFKDTAALI